jgi:hypothetical protein
MDELEQIKQQLKNLEEDMQKMQTCAIVIKRLVEKYTKVNIDDLVKKEMEVNKNEH